MEKQAVREMLERAVADTHAHYENFHGIVLFGSFVTPKPNPGDIDIIPVLGSYDGSWNFQQYELGDFDTDYYTYLQMEAHFGRHFTHLSPAYGCLFKTMRNKRGLFHVESIVALDNLFLLRQTLMEYETSPEHFIGTEFASEAMKRHYESVEALQERILIPY